MMPGKVQARNGRSCETLARNAEVAQSSIGALGVKLDPQPRRIDRRVKKPALASADSSSCSLGASDQSRESVRCEC